MALQGDAAPRTRQKIFHNSAPRRSPRVVIVRVGLYKSARTSIKPRTDLCTLKKEAFDDFVTQTKGTCICVTDVLFRNSAVRPYPELIGCLLLMPWKREIRSSVFHLRRPDKRMGDPRYLRGWAYKHECEVLLSPRNLVGQVWLVWDRSLKTTNSKWALKTRQTDGLKSQYG